MPGVVSVRSAVEDLPSLRSRPCPRPRFPPAATSRAGTAEDLRRERDDRDPPDVPPRVRRGARPRARASRGRHRARRGAVATQLETLSIGLHAHHEGEDERLWGPLEERAPSCTAHVERMKAQHAELLVHLTALDRALPAWRASAKAADAAPVLAALDGVNAAIAVHLPDEETNIVPVMEYTITEAEVEWFARARAQGDPQGPDLAAARRDPRGAARRRRRVAAQAHAGAGAARVAVDRQAEVREAPRRARGADRAPPASRRDRERRAGLRRPPAVRGPVRPGRARTRRPRAARGRAARASSGSG